MGLSLKGKHRNSKRSCEKLSSTLRKKIVTLNCIRSLSSEIIKLIKNWLTEHLLIEDIKFATFSKENRDNLINPRIEEKWERNQ